MPSTEARPAQSSLAERYRVLLDIGRTLNGTLSLDELYRAIYRETARVVEASGFYISLYDQARDLATVVFFADRDEERRAAITYRGSDSDVIRTGQSSIVHDRTEVRSLMVLGEADSDVTRSAISAPLRHKGRVLGAISTQSYRPRAYRDEDLELLEGIADIAAVAIENARQFEALELSRREAEQMEEIGRAVTSSLDASAVLETVVRAVLQLLPADGVSVWAIEDRRARVEASAGEIALPLDLTWELSGWIEEELLEARRPVMINDLQGSAEVPEEVRPHLQAGSGVGVPLTVGGEVVGALTAGSRHPHDFSRADLRVLERLAGQASVALENARLHQDLQALTLTDPLTLLPNRRHLEIHLEKEVAAARRGRLVTLVLFDVDEFKEFNDNHGHVAGDDALRAFAEVLHEENREMNLVARYGGDEFVSVLTESDAEGARQYVRRVGERLEDHPVLSPHGFAVSAGVASFDPESMESTSDLIHAADEEMYRHKPRPDRT